MGIDSVMLRGYGAVIFPCMIDPQLKNQIDYLIENYGGVFHYDGYADNGLTFIPASKPEHLLGWVDRRPLVLENLECSSLERFETGTIPDSLWTSENDKAYKQLFILLDEVTDRTVETPMKRDPHITVTSILDDCINYGIRKMKKQNPEDYLDDISILANILYNGYGVITGEWLIYYNN